MKPLAHEQASGTETRSTRSERVDAVVVCSDDALLIELGPVLGERYRTHSVDTPADIAASVTAPRWIGIVDVDSVPDARGAIARLEMQFHRCPLILLSSRPQEWGAAISRGAAVAAMSRQDAAGPRLLDALAGAEARLLADPESTTAVPPGGAARAGKFAPRRGSGVRWLAVAGVCLVLGAGAWWLAHRPPVARHAAGGTLSSGTAQIAAGAPGRAAVSPGSAAEAAVGSSADTAQPAAAAPGASGTASAPTAGVASGQGAGAPATAQPQSVLELLSAARVAFRDQRLLLPRPDGEPRGDSALELYAQVLSQDPDNDEAQDGVRRLFIVGKARIQADLVSGKLDDATRLVGLFKDAGVSADALRDLSASIVAARPKWIEQHAQQDLAAGDLKSADELIGQLAAQGTDPAGVAQLHRAVDARKVDLQLTGMATQVHAAITAGNLLQPADDNARTRLAAMRTLARNNPTTLASQHDVQVALIGRGEQATQSGQFDTAQRFFGAAADLGGSTQLADARRTLQSAMTAAAKRGAVAAAAAKAAAAAAAATPTAQLAGAAAATPQPPPYIAARPIRPLDVTYPPNTNATGYVVVEFTLSPDGTASDMSVVSASPPGVFNQTAVEAVGSGRYDTHQLVNGQPVRARIRLRFQSN